MSLASGVLTKPDALPTQLQGFGVSKESRRARREAIRARLQHDHEITDISLGQVHAIGEQIQRRAQRPDYRGNLAFGSPYAIADDDRVVLADDLAEVAGSGEMVMQPAIGHEKHAAARELAVDDATDIEARLTDQVTTQFQHEFCMGQQRRGAAVFL